MQTDKPDLKTLVATYPFASIAIGFAAGAGLAYVTRPRTLLGRAIVTIVGGVVRTIALDKVTTYAASAAAGWLAARDHPAPMPNGIPIS